MVTISNNRTIGAKTATTTLQRTQNIQNGSQIIRRTAPKRTEPATTEQEQTASAQTTKNRNSVSINGETFYDGETIIDSEGNTRTLRIKDKAGTVIAPANSEKLTIPKKDVIDSWDEQTQGYATQYRTMTKDATDYLTSRKRDLSTASNPTEWLSIAGDNLVANTGLTLIETPIVIADTVSGINKFRKTVTNNNLSAGDAIKLYGENLADFGQKAVTSIKNDPELAIDTAILSIATAGAGGAVSAGVKTASAAAKVTASTVKKTVSKTATKTKGAIESVKISKAQNVARKSGQYAPSISKGATTKKATATIKKMKVEPSTAVVLKSKPNNGPRVIHSRGGEDVWDTGLMQSLSGVERTIVDRARTKAGGFLSTNDALNLIQKYHQNRKGKAEAERIRAKREADWERKIQNQRKAKRQASRDVEATKHGKYELPEKVESVGKDGYSSRKKAPKAKSISDNAKQYLKTQPKYVQETVEKVRQSGTNISITTAKKIAYEARTKNYSGRYPALKAGTGEMYGVRSRNFTGGDGTLRIDLKDIRKERATRSTDPKLTKEQEAELKSYREEQDALEAKKTAAQAKYRKTHPNGKKQSNKKKFVKGPIRKQPKEEPTVNLTGVITPSDIRGLKVIATSGPDAVPKTAAPKTTAKPAAPKAGAVKMKMAVKSDGTVEAIPERQASAKKTTQKQQQKQTQKIGAKIRAKNRRAKKTTAVARPRQTTVQTKQKQQARPQQKALPAGNTPKPQTTQQKQIPGVQQKSRRKPIPFNPANSVAEVKKTTTGGTTQTANPTTIAKASVSTTTAGTTTDTKPKVKKTVVSKQAESVRPATANKPKTPAKPLASPKTAAKPRPRKSEEPKKRRKVMRKKSKKTAIRREQVNQFGWLGYDNKKAAAPMKIRYN